MDAEAYVLNRAIGERDGEYGEYSRAFEALHSRRDSHLARLDRFLKAPDGTGLSADATLKSLEAIWTDALERVRAGKLDEAQGLLGDRRSAALMGKMRHAFESFLADWNSHFADHETRIEIGKSVVLLSQLVIAGMMIFAFRSGAREAQARAAAIQAMDASRTQVGHLFEMTDMLQSATDHHDANAACGPRPANSSEGSAARSTCSTIPATVSSCRPPGPARPESPCPNRSPSTSAGR